MSELKLYEIDTDYPNSINSGSYYDRDEVDAVLAAKDEEIAGWKAGYSNLLNVDIPRIETNLKSEIHRQKRALWLERANDASSFASLFSTLSDIEDDESRTYWIFGNKRKIVIDGLKCHRMETSYKWFCIWDNVADKCRAMAEKFGG